MIIMSRNSLFDFAIQYFIVLNVHVMNAASG